MKNFLFIFFVFLAYQCIAMEKAPEIYPCKKLTVAIHKDLHDTFLRCMRTHKLVKDVNWSPISQFTRHITTHIFTKDRIFPDKNSDRFHAILRQEKIGKNAKRKLKNIIAAYQALSSYRKNEHIFYNEDTGIQMIGGWQHIFAPDIMEYFYVLAEDLPTLCALAKIPLNKNLLNT